LLPIGANNFAGAVCRFPGGVEKADHFIIHSPKFFRNWPSAMLPNGA
jgi:hypothetical protein